MTKDDSLRVRLPGDLKERLQGTAEQLRVTPSELLRQAVEFLVDGIRDGELHSVNGRLGYTLRAGHKIAIAPMPGTKAGASKRVQPSTKPDKGAPARAVMGSSRRG